MKIVKGKNILVVIDMQNDFITGSLANKDAERIVPGIVDEINSEKYDFVIATLDTHDNSSYLNSNEGKHLPVKHCIIGTNGHHLEESIGHAIGRRVPENLTIHKGTFGTLEWSSIIPDEAETITLVGTCTDICVVSNALILKAMFPEVNVRVIGDLCAGLTKEKHEAALDVMRSCQVEVL